MFPKGTIPVFRMMACTLAAGFAMSTMAVADEVDNDSPAEAAVALKSSANSEPVQRARVRTTFVAPGKGTYICSPSGSGMRSRCYRR